MKLRLNISTCPNDTFMFEALLHGRVDTEGIVFEPYFADIEQLNVIAAGRNRSDITKLSYACYPCVKHYYTILQSGSALGRGNGPLLVSKGVVGRGDLAGKTVAIPGEYTTANLLLRKFFPEIGATKNYLFSDIASAVISGDADAGVLIHEGRFTYESLGLNLVADLGHEWETSCGLALPLGAIVASRSLPEETVRTVDRVLRRSIEYAFANPDASREFVKHHAREMDDSVIGKHIALFVNEFSLDLGPGGRQAVEALLGKVFD